MTEQKWWLVKDDYVGHTDMDAHPITGDMVYGVNKKDIINNVSYYSFRVYVQWAETGRIEELRRYVAGTDSQGPYSPSSVKIQPSGNLTVLLSECFNANPIKIGASINVIYGVFQPYDLTTWDEARIQALETRLEDQAGQIAALQARVDALEGGSGGLTEENEKALAWVKRETRALS